MQKAPIFIEAPVSTNPLILSSMRDLLTKDGYAPVYYAKSPEELRQIIEKVLMGEFSPSVFVVNTCGAETLLDELDLIIGDTPALFLHPERNGDDSELTNARRSKRAITACLNQMRTPHKGIWRYNEDNWMELTLRGVQRLENYFTSGDPNCLEIELSNPPLSQLQYLPNYEEQASILKQLARNH